MSRTINMAAGVPQEFYEVSNFFRILAASGPLTVEFYFGGREVTEAIDVTEGYAEKFETGTFDRVRLVSPTNQTVQFVQRLGNVVQYDKAPVGDSNIVGSVPLALDAPTLAALESIDLNPATLLALQRPTLPTNQATQNAQLVANTAQIVIPAANNVNGAIVWAAEAADQLNPVGCLVLIAKATAPANIIDGEVIATSAAFPISTVVYTHLKTAGPVRLAPGLGLWFIASTAGSVASAVRFVRYTLL